MNQESWLPPHPRWAVAVRRVALGVGVVMLFAANLVAQDFGLPASQEAVLKYDRSDDLTDPVSLLQRKVERGEVKLEFEKGSGYLRSVLKQLNVPVSSQTLAFSKTSVQVDLIDPQNPRSMYFNEGVYVAWVPGSNHLEFAAMDPKKGAVFYTLNQEEADKPRFDRQVSCMRCHLGPKTTQVPGFLVRSVLTGSDGRPASQMTEFVSGHNSPMRLRWGGWYVTGTSKNDVHLGNSFLEDRRHPEAFDPDKGSNVLSIKDRLDTSKYLSPDSDIVSLLVLDDAVRMQDLIIHASYGARLIRSELNESGSQRSPRPDWAKKRLEADGEPLLAYLLFRDEAPLKGEVKGTSSFAADFQKVGPKDSKGRSLRELDLKTRLFRYPCNYQIYSKAFDALPKEMKQYLWIRLAEVLTGNDHSSLYKGMSIEDRTAVMEILLETKREFRAYCRSQRISTPQK